MANTLNLGNGNWATKEDSLLAYNSENGNFKPLPFDFTRASSATVVNKAGLIETVGSGEPRIDFSNDAKGALKLEPQRSNLYTYSEDFSNSNWSKDAVSVNANQIVSPSGSVFSDEIIENSSTTEHSVRQLKSITSGNYYTISVFVKESSNPRDIYIRCGDANILVYFDTTNWIVGDEVQGSGKIENYGNGWYRLIATGLASSTGADNFRFGLSNGTTNGSQIYAGNGVNSMYFYGASLEQGSYATSYIPTQGSAVTRVADSSSQTPPSGIIGQTEGTVLFDYTPYDVSSSTSEDTIPLAISNNGSISDSIYLNDYNGNLDLFIRVGGTVQAQIQFSSLADNQRFKLGIGYAVNNLVFYINGVQIGIDTSLSLPTCNQIKLNGFTSNVHINRINVNDVKLYNTRLSNAELTALTK